ncbi:MAG: hypothetical protein KAX49_05920 [Halanaerobiales bacterium]|nr:hypothetical protein [Halanaerobiales bacterium]
MKENYTIINLDDYFNADGISYDSNPGNGHFGISSFPAELLPESGTIIKIHDVPFLFPLKEDDYNNNIECNNQKITIHEGYYSVIHFLGSCDNGSFRERIEVVYEDQKEVIRVGFSDWCSSKPLYGESIAFYCDHCHTKKGDNFNNAFAMWFQSVELDDKRIIKEIILPNNPCFHIFAITLSKG